MTINCAIIDDEPLAAGLLESYVAKTPYLNLTGTYNSAITAMRDLRDNPVPLLFLDIQMPELSGVEFAKILPKDTKIIFTTAFPQYALEGYKVNALDYLLKPISYEDFLRATEKAQDWYNILQKREAYNDDRIMFIKSEYTLLRVCSDDILYVEGLKDYVRICLKFLTRSSCVPIVLISSTCLRYALLTVSVSFLAMCLSPSRITTRRRCSSISTRIRCPDSE